MATERQITIYSTPTCPYCQHAKRYLSDKGVVYTEKDVTTDIAARDELVRKSGRLQVPVIEIDGSIVVGFNRPKLEELLKL